MKRRWKIVLAGGAILLAAALGPIIYIETACRTPLPGIDRQSPHKPLVQDSAWRRGEARTWLTYPEWHIVHSAESYGRFLERSPPSAFPYLRHVRGFWSSYCAVNRAAAGQPGGGEARVMLYTIGLSYSAELLLKAGYENSFGRIFEWVSGWRTADDRYAAMVQQRYGAFMHEVPWYEFPFGEALRGLWRTREPDAQFRHWERRLALSAEYGLKAGYAAVIGWASGATLGPDERTLRFVARSDAQRLRAVDDRLRPVREIDGGLVLVEAPRYAQFTDLLVKLSETPAELVEISGNDDIFLTLVTRGRQQLPPGATELFAATLDDRPGWRRVGVSTKVQHLLPLIRAVGRSGGEVEHVHDY